MLLNIILVAVGFLLGYLVKRNNPQQLKLDDFMEDMKAEIEKLKKK
jgi:uncharacterized membrane-anchored protein YhcB (DUF1043 family)